MTQRTLRSSPQLVAALGMLGPLLVQILVESRGLNHQLEMGEEISNLHQEGSNASPRRILKFKYDLAVICFIKPVR